MGVVIFFLFAPILSLLFGSLIVTIFSKSKIWHGYNKITKILVEISIYVIVFIVSVLVMGSIILSNT